PLGSHASTFPDMVGVVTGQQKDLIRSGNRNEQLGARGPHDRTGRNCTRIDGQEVSEPPRCGMPRPMGKQIEQVVACGEIELGARLTIEGGQGCGNRNDALLVIERCLRRTLMVDAAQTHGAVLHRRRQGRCLEFSTALSGKSSQIARAERATRVQLVVPRVSAKAPGSQSNGATCDEIDRCRWLPVSSHYSSRFCPIGTKRRTSKESPQEKWIVKFGFDRCMAAVYCGSDVHGGCQQSGGDSPANSGPAPRPAGSRAIR